MRGHCLPHRWAKGPANFFSYFYKLSEITHKHLTQSSRCVSDHQTKTTTPHNTRDNTVAIVPRAKRSSLTTPPPQRIMSKRTNAMPKLWGSTIQGDINLGFWVSTGRSIHIYCVNVKTRLISFEALGQHPGDGKRREIDKLMRHCLNNMLYYFRLYPYLTLPPHPHRFAPPINDPPGPQ